MSACGYERNGLRSSSYTINVRFFEWVCIIKCMFTTNCNIGHVNWMFRSAISWHVLDLHNSVIGYTHLVKDIYQCVMASKWYTSFLGFFSVRLLSVLRGHSGFDPRHNGQWPPTSKDLLSQILTITFIFLS